MYEIYEVFEIKNCTPEGVQRKKRLIVSNSPITCFIR